jgi:hypothetical protein
MGICIILVGECLFAIVCVCVCVCVFRNHLTNIDPLIDSLIHPFIMTGPDLYAVSYYSYLTFKMHSVSTWDPNSEHAPPAYPSGLHN